MKVLHLSFSKTGGAGVSTARLSDALNKTGVESEFVYFKPYSKATARIGWLEKKVNGLVNIILSRILNVGTVNFLPTSLLRVINRSDADIIHLHWINAGMLAIEQITKINKPIVWTFHDMWPICGTKNIVYDDRYVGNNCKDLGMLDRWVWHRKNKCWRNLDARVCCPSSWLAGCVKKSGIFSTYPIHVLPNGLDLSVFSPASREDARREIGLPADKKVIIFGACDPYNFNKGGDLLREALAMLDSDRFELIVYGAEGQEQIAGIKTRWVGFIDSEKELANLYSVADVVCVPSRVETFGQAASEPQACGIPVVAFNSTGLRDVVEHKVTGYLAEPFDVNDFAYGIEWVLTQDAATLGKAARALVEGRFSEESVVGQALKIYDDALSSQNAN